MYDIEKIKLQKLPSRSDFYSKLKEEDITYEDYNKANHIWNRFDIKYLGDYHDLYVKADVLLLADV